MKNLLSSLLLLVLITLSTQLPGCATKGLKSGPALTPKVPNEISIMAFNVENLFDNQHDKGTDDFPYLPLLAKKTDEVRAGCSKQKGSYRQECFDKDWNDEIIAKKLKNISEVILSVDDKKGPDVLFLEEVENNNILGQLNKEYLKESGYITQVLIEGFDERGIDVALLSRLPLDGKPKLHKIPYKGENANDQKWMEKSRGILEVPLKLPDGSRLTAMVAHFPSQRNPRYWRAQSVEYVQKLFKDREKEMIVLGGDLNITYDENEEAGFFSKQLSQVGLVSHLVGCKHCDGTHFYRNDWSFLDVLLFSKSLGPDGSGTYVLEPQTIDVPRYVTNHLVRARSPRRFTDEGQGVSDHFPIYGRIRPRALKPAN